MANKITLIHIGTKNKIRIEKWNSFLDGNKVNYKYYFIFKNNKQHIGENNKRKINVKKLLKIILNKKFKYPKKKSYYYNTIYYK